MDTELIMRKIRDNAFGLIIVAVCVLIAYKTYNKKEADLRTLSMSADTEKKKNDLLTEISSLEKKFTFFKDRINTKAPASVINSLGNIAKESNVKLTYIRPGNEDKMAEYTRYPFELSVISTDYHGFARFISNLERSPELYTVDRMDVSFDSEGGNSMMTVKLMVSTLLLN